MNIRAFFSKALISFQISTYFTAKTDGQHRKVGSSEEFRQLSICFLKKADKQLYIL